MTILGHLISSHKLKKRHVETVGLIVRTLTVRETAAVARGGKGEMLSAQGKKKVQNFTLAASTDLHNSEHMKAKKSAGEFKRGNDRGEGEKRNQMMSWLS